MANILYYALKIYNTIIKTFFLLKGNTIIKT